jgi:hypothetical protein
MARRRPVKPAARGKIGALRSFFRYPPEQRRFLLEALLLLVLARLALRLLPFRRLRPFFDRRPRRPPPDPARRQRLRQQVSWAIGRAAAHLPGQTVCFPRGIAAQIMLVHRGVPATLYYGAATLPGRGLTAHVWVQDGAAGVVGHQEAAAYKILARYPQNDP